MNENSPRYEICNGRSTITNIFIWYYFQSTQMIEILKLTKKKTFLWNFLQIPYVAKGDENHEQAN